MPLTLNHRFPSVAYPDSANSVVQVFWRALVERKPLVDRQSLAFFWHPQLWHEDHIESVALVLHLPDALPQQLDLCSWLLLQEFVEFLERFLPPFLA
jgi:hypothetical protein